MKARNLLLFVLVAILGNACSSQDAQDLPTLSGEVIQDYLYTDITAGDLQKACIRGAWTKLCILAVEGSALAARIDRYAEENGLDGVACDGFGGNEPSEESRVHAGDQVKAFNAAGTLIGLTSVEPGVNSIAASKSALMSSEVRYTADPVVIVVTCPLSFEVQLTEESPSTPSQLAAHQDPATQPATLKNRAGT